MLASSCTSGEGSADIVSGIIISAGFCGLDIPRGRLNTLSLFCRSTGVIGGVMACMFSEVYGTTDRRSDGVRTEVALEAGALWMVVFDTEIDGLRSFHFTDRDGQRLLSRAVRLSPECSPDRRRFGERVPECSLAAQ